MTATIDVFQCKSAVLIDTGKILAKRNLSVPYCFWLYLRLDDNFYSFCALLPNIKHAPYQEKGIKFENDRNLSRGSHFVSSDFKSFFYVGLAS